MKNGFTLAEVLITLGIIGVVAAITMPSLITNIQDKHFKAMWKKNFALLENALLGVKQDNPGITICENFKTNSKEFIDAFLAHLDIVDTCGSNGYDDIFCNETKHKWMQPWFKDLSGKYIVGAQSVRHALLKNGARIFFIGDGHTSLVSIGIDVNNIKGPNKLGRDIFVVGVYDKKINNSVNEKSNLENIVLIPWGSPNGYCGKNGGKYTSCKGIEGCSPDIGLKSNYPSFPDAPGAGCAYSALYE